MPTFLRKLRHSPHRLRALLNELKYVVTKTIRSANEARLIRRRLRNIRIERSSTQGVVVFNAARATPVVDVESYLAHLMSLMGFTTYILFDDGELEHWDSAQVHNLKYYSPYHARWFIKWGSVARKYLIYFAFRRPGVKLVNYSTIIHHIGSIEPNQPSDHEYAMNSTERFYEVSPIDLEGKHSDYYHRSLHNCIISRSVAKYVLEELQPDLYVTSHGVYSTWGPAYREIKEADIPTVIYQIVGTTTGKIRLIDRQDGILASTADWQEFCKTIPVDAPEIEQGAKLLEERLAHRTQDTREYFGSGLEDPYSEVLSGEIQGITFGMFPNVIWDGNVSQRNIMFKNVVDWCEYTINAFRDINHNLVVRFHPSETTRLIGTVRLEEIIREKIPDIEQITNVTLISSEQKLDTYQFSRSHVDVGLIYDGTLCIEFTHMGIPVIACTDGNFTPDSIVYKPQTKDEYRSYLHNPAMILDQFEAERHERMLQARKFAFWLFEASLMDFGPIEIPYPPKMNYRQIPKSRSISADDQKIINRMLKPLNGIDRKQNQNSSLG